jgi:hypothetical protein
MSFDDDTPASGAPFTMPGPAACIECAAPMPEPHADAGRCPKCVAKWLRKAARTPTRRDCESCGQTFAPKSAPKSHAGPLYCPACADWRAIEWHSVRITDAAVELAKVGGIEPEPQPIASTLAYHLAQRGEASARIRKREAKAQRETAKARRTARRTR